MNYVPTNQQGAHYVRQQSDTVGCICICIYANANMCVSVCTLKLNKDMHVLLRVITYLQTYKTNEYLKS